MAQIRQLTGLAFDRHEEIVGPALAQPHQNGPDVPGTAQIPVQNPEGASHANEDQPAARRRSDDHVTAASQREGFRTNATETQGRAGAEGRAGADRDEATTWANAFIAEAQHAADAAEASTQARRAPAPAPAPWSAPATTGDRVAQHRVRYVLM